MNPLANDIYEEGRKQSKILAMRMRCKYLSIQLAQELERSWVARILIRITWMVQLALLSPLKVPERLRRLR